LLPGVEGVIQMNLCGACIRIGERCVTGTSQQTGTTGSVGVEVDKHCLERNPPLDPDPGHVCTEVADSWKESVRFPSHPFKSPFNGLVLVQLSIITGKIASTARPVHQMSQRGASLKPKTEIDKLTLGITSRGNTETLLHPITRLLAHPEATPPRGSWPHCPRPGPSAAPAPARRAPRPATPRPRRPRSRRPSRQSAPAGPESCRP